MQLFNILNNCNSNTCACAGTIGTGIPGDLVNIIHYVYLAIQVIVPILLIIFGMIELAKAIAAQKEDEIKKAQGGLFKKAIIAVIVFLVFSLTRLVFNFANSGNPDSKSIWKCVDSIINANCSTVCGNDSDNDENTPNKQGNTGNNPSIGGNGPYNQ